MLSRFLKGAALSAMLLAIPMLASSRPEKSAWPAETLTGKITMVDPGAKLVVIQDRDGVPFDMEITPATRIRSGDQSEHPKDLSQQTNQTATVRFIPERGGDVAQSIQIGR
jgi:hypothetical protein